MQSRLDIGHLYINTPAYLYLSYFLTPHLNIIQHTAQEEELENCKGTSRILLASQHPIVLAIFLPVICRTCILHGGVTGGLSAEGRTLQQVLVT